MTIVILDWDDSLFINVFRDNETIKTTEYFEKIDESIKNLVSYLKTFDNILINILTSSTNNWVDHCINTYKLYKTKEAIRNIPIIYVSDLIPSWVTINAIEHKLYVIYKLYYNTYKNYITIGDSGQELYAFKKMTTRSDIICKHIQLIQNPTLEALIDQHKCIIDNFRNILTFEKNLHFKIE